MEIATDTLHLTNRDNIMELLQYWRALKKSAHNNIKTPCQNKRDNLMKPFQYWQELSNGIEGWFTHLAADITDKLLLYQRTIPMSGHLLEIGAWHGLSSILWLAHARPKEQVHIFDLEARDPLIANLNRASKILPNNPTYEIYKVSSHQRPDPEFIAKYYRQFRLIHIDGDHSEAGIYNDMNVCLDLLHTRGLMVIDDFLNPRFPQISEVTFNILRNRSFELALLGSGANKAWIVRTKFFDWWRSATNISAKFEGTVGGRPCWGFR